MDDNISRIQQLLLGLGSLAETLGAFHRNLVDQGFTREEALAVTIEFMKINFTMLNGSTDSEE